MTDQETTGEFSGRRAGDRSPLAKGPGAALSYVRRRLSSPRRPRAGEAEEEKEADLPAVAEEEKEAEADPPLRRRLTGSRLPQGLRVGSMRLSHSGLDLSLCASEREGVADVLGGEPVSVRELFPRVERTQEPVPIVMISDPGQDLDDEMMFIMSSYLHSLGLIKIQGVIANLYPSLARARLTRGTFNLLGLQHVPVGIGTDGGDTSGMHSSDQFEAAASSYIIPDDDVAAVGELEEGGDLLRRLYQAAEDVRYTEEGEVEGGLTILVTSSMKDISLFARDEPDLFAAKTREVVLMGGCHPVLDYEGECTPDSAQNNAFDPEASARFYSQCQRTNVTLTVVARHAAYAAKMPRSVYDDLASTGSAIGSRLRESQKTGIDQLWARASSDDPAARKGLPPRCNRKWFTETFCGGEDDPTRTGEDSIWDLVTGFMQYDTLALLASVPLMREAYFDPTVLPPLHDREGKVMYDEVRAFDVGTRNLIGISAGEHNLRDPDLVVQLLKIGYRRGLLCNHISGLTA